jgi:hypothetical protein
MVDLTEAYGQLAVLISRSGGEYPPSVRITEKLQRTLSFNPVTAEGAADPRSPVTISGAGETARRVREYFCWLRPVPQLPLSGALQALPAGARLPGYGA